MVQKVIGTIMIILALLMAIWDKFIVKELIKKMGAKGDDMSASYLATKIKPDRFSHIFSREEN